MHDQADAVLAEAVSARNQWLAKTVASLDVSAVWLAGSLGRGIGDAWSDVDLLVVGSEMPLERLVVEQQPMLTLAAPHNGPVTGDYIGAMYDIGQLPLWVDWYQWPAELPAPRDAQLLAGHGVAGNHTLFEALDDHGRGFYVESDRATFTLAMLPIAAKMVGRANWHAADAMAHMLDLDDASIVDGLRNVLRRLEPEPMIRDRISRLIDVAEACSGFQPPRRSM